LGFACDRLVFMRNYRDSLAFRTPFQAREFVEVMVRRKEEYFASNRRAIISFELTDMGDDYHLSVASTL
jgi:hypothetical protein